MLFVGRSGLAETDVLLSFRGCACKKFILPRGHIRFKDGLICVVNTAYGFDKREDSAESTFKMLEILMNRHSSAGSFA